MEVSQRRMERIAIRSNWQIEAIEINLKEHIRNCEMWGDLDLSIDEYRNIKKKISDILICNSTASKIKHLFRKYPVTLVSDIINFVLFDFDNNDFWSSWANRFNVSLSVTDQTEIGSMIHRIFKKYNFDIIEDGGYKYVTPILCQAGIPCTCFIKIFDILESTLNSPHFSAREMVEELRGYRNYMIDAPVERYFRLHTERASELITTLRDMMHSLGATACNDTDLYFAGIDTRIINQYVQWRIDNKSRKSKDRRSEQYYNPPRLNYDNCKGICILLPGQVLKQDMIYKIQWVITYDDGVKKITNHSQVYNIDGRNYTNEICVPVDIAKNYKIELFDSEDTTKLLTSNWHINGINNENPVLVFNELGVLMSQKFISSKGAIIAFDSNQTHISEKQGVQELISIDLPKTWLNTRAYKVYSAEKRASITLDTFGEKLKIECKHNYNLEFVQSGTLFDEKFSIQETPVFVTFPTIEINGDVNDWEKTRFGHWQITIIHRLSNTKRILMLSEIGVSQHLEGIRFSLEECIRSFYSGLFGPYEVRVYDGKNRRNLSFNIAPNIGYSVLSVNMEKDALFIEPKAGFYFKNIECVNVEFENGVKVIPTAKRGTTWYHAITESKGAFINGQIAFEYLGNKYKIPFKKTIRNMQWQFWNETKNELEDYGAKLFYSDELIDEKWRLAIHFTNISTIYHGNEIVLESSTGERLQSKELIIDKEGNCIINMNLFQDTMEAHKLPQRLMLYNLKEENDLTPICLAIIRNFVEISNPKFLVSKGNSIIYWDRGNDLSGKKLKLSSLNNPELELPEYPLDEIRTFKNKEKKYEGIIISKILPNGVYRIDAVENEDGFFFEEDIQDKVHVFEKERMLYVNSEELLKELLNKKNAMLYDWLPVIIISLRKKKWIDVVATEMKNQIEKQAFDFDIEKCTSILFLLLLATDDKSNLSAEIKEKLRDVCASVNLWCITDSNRMDILKQLLESNMKDDDCLLIIEELQLYLFKSSGNSTFDRSCMQRLWELNESMAVLANIRRCTVDISTDLLRISNHINLEVLEQIIKFTPIVGCKTSEWLDCFENVISGKCICKKMNFECSKRVWGDGHEWGNLFTKVKSEYKLIPPDESHTDGYAIMGTNYLTLIYTLMIRKSEEASSAEIKAIRHEFKVENLLSKYNGNFTNIHDVLRKRIGDKTGGTHKLFYLIGGAAMLEALASHKRIENGDQRELLPFWKNVIKAYPKLVYRDLIIAELSVMFDNERSKKSCQ